MFATFRLTRHLVECLTSFVVPLLLSAAFIQPSFGQDTTWDTVLSDAGDLPFVSFYPLSQTVHSAPEGITIEPGLELSCSAEEAIWTFSAPTPLGTPDGLNIVNVPVRWKTDISSAQVTRWELGFDTFINLADVDLSGDENGFARIFAQSLAAGGKTLFLEVNGTDQYITSYDLTGFADALRENAALCGLRANEIGTDPGTN